MDREEINSRQSPPSWSHEGFGFIEVLVTLGIMGVGVVALMTMNVNQAKFMRAATLGQEARSITDGILIAIGAERLCPQALSLPTFPASWAMAGGTPPAVELNEISLSGTPLLTKGVSVRGIIARKILLTRLDGPFDVQVNTQANPAPPAATPSVQSMKRYYAKLTVEMMKASTSSQGAADGEANIGGDQMPSKDFFLTLTVKNDNALYSCTGGQNRDFFEDICVNEFGGDYDANRHPSCLLSRVSIATDFNLRDSRLTNPVASGVPGTFDGSGLSTESLTTNFILPGFGDIGPWSGANTIRSWFGPCSDAQCEYAGALGRKYMHLSGWTNPSFPQAASMPNKPRVIGLMDTVVLPARDARLGIGTEGLAPKGVLFARNSFSGVDGTVPTGYFVSEQAQGSVVVEGYGDSVGTYSALYLKTTAASAPAWVMAYKSASPAGGLGLAWGNLTPAGWTGLNQVITLTQQNRVGINTTTPSEALSVVGNVNVAGTLVASGPVTSTSDLRLKTDIRAIPDALTRVAQVRGVEFRWKDETKTQSPQIGFIAQEIERVFPEAVVTSDDGLKSVAYGNLVAPLFESIRSLLSRLMGVEAREEKLRERLQEMEKRMKAMEDRLAALATCGSARSSQGVKDDGHGE